MKITIEDVGRKVVLRNGQQTVIKGFTSALSYPVICAVDEVVARDVYTDTGLIKKGSTSSLDIVKFLEEPVDLTQLEKPFGLLDSETQKALIDHGGPYSVYNGSGWIKVEVLTWFNPEVVYRARREPEKYTNFLGLFDDGSCKWYSNEKEASRVLKYRSSQVNPILPVKITWDKEGNVEIEKIK